jgi:hypothetical protein
LKELAEKHGDLEITRGDSLNAGNCTSGTDEFIAEYFKGRDSVKVSELAEYIDDFQGVRNVLEYKFRQLEEQAAEESAKPEEEQSEDIPEDEHPF